VDLENAHPEPDSTTLEESTTAAALDPSRRQENSSHLDFISEARPEQEESEYGTVELQLHNLGQLKRRYANNRGC
jgi:hypothetical protein